MFFFQFLHCLPLFVLPSSGALQDSLDKAVVVLSYGKGSSLNFLCLGSEILETLPQPNKSDTLLTGR